MRLLASRKQRPVGPVEPSLQPNQKQRVYDNADDSYNTAFHHAAGPSSMSFPGTPPPGYQPPANWGLEQLRPVAPAYSQPPQYRQYPQHSMLNVYPPQPSASASTSTLEVSRPHTAGGERQEQRWQSSAGTASHPATSGRHDCTIARTMNQGAAFCDRIAAGLMDVLSRTDGDAPAQDELEPTMRALEVLEVEDQESVAGPSNRTNQTSAQQRRERTRSANHIINFNKSWLYHNSRLPPGMVPFIAYLPTWSLVCRGAQASVDVYTRPPKDQRDFYMDADPKQGTKATIVKSQTVDDRKLIIVAIRGSKWNMVDWTVNFALEPTQPVDFLDDEGNKCHSGFLEVARAMVPTVAAQLRRVIEDDPSWATSSLMFTGHSAGGAVASLLYVHMLCEMPKSNIELTVLAGIFKRVHCVTFGAPPVSLLPLQVATQGRNNRNQFLAFANEGDLVVRADRAYLGSLVKLLAAPAPSTSTRARLRERVSRPNLRGTGARPAGAGPLPYWPVPEGTLSNAGRLVLLREKPRTSSHAVEAVQVTDGELRDVMFGDPAMHPMTVYKQRLDTLAFAAVSGNEAG